MTETVPVEAPDCSSPKARVISGTRRGWLWGQIFARCLSVWPLAALERAWGVSAPASRQFWIVPAGLVLGTFWFRSTAVLAPRRGGERLTVSAGHLDFHPEQGEPCRIERADVGLVDVDGDDVSGRLLIKVYNANSELTAAWAVQWPGWSPPRVSRVLRRAGYPAAPHSQIYDGTFQDQVPGGRPRVARGLSPG